MQIPKLEQSRLNILSGELEKDYMKDIKKVLAEEIEKGEIIYPKPENIFNALNSTSLDDIKVVILGQDPYHGAGQAHGLSFSVLDGVAKPPSLQNIFKELKSDLGIEIPVSGNLEKWTREGVLLLNAILTVKANNPASHSKIGWEKFTDKIIKVTSDTKENVVFLLWGAFAQSKENLIDSSKHLILKAPHPSPFSAYKGFLGCHHFSRSNAYLKEKGMKPIEWNLE